VAAGLYGEKQNASEFGAGAGRITRGGGGEGGIKIKISKERRSRKKFKGNIAQAGFLMRSIGFLDNSCW
jgi:hypothetical protein